MEVPALIVVGDADSVRTSHAVAFFELLGGGKQDAGWDGSGMPDARLAILPGTTHYGIFSSSAYRRHAVPGHARAIKIAVRESQELWPGVGTGRKQ
jgi:hypothetical protein